MKELFFKPWIGNRYNSGIKGKKILLLGESHYGTSNDYTSDFTIRMVNKLAINGNKAYFTKIAKIISGIGYDKITPDQKNNFWQSVAFSNYIQFMVDESQGHRRPTNKMWLESRFVLDILNDSLESDLIFILGKELFRNVETKNLSTPFMHTTHPSTSIKYDVWVPRVQEFIDGH